MRFLHLCFIITAILEQTYVRSLIELYEFTTNWNFFFCRLNKGPNWLKSVSRAFRHLKITLVTPGLRTLSLPSIKVTKFLRMLEKSWSHITESKLAITKSKVHNPICKNKPFVSRGRSQHVAIFWVTFKLIMCLQIHFLYNTKLECLNLGLGTLIKADLFHTHL